MQAYRSHNLSCHVMSEPLLYLQRSHQRNAFVYMHVYMYVYERSNIIWLNIVLFDACFLNLNFFFPGKI